MSGHTSELRWDNVKAIVSQSADQVKKALIEGEDQYQEMLELYQYAGGTAQGLADQLFAEQWQSRTTPGVQAEITYDVTGGSVTGVTLAQAGTGYPDGTGYTLAVQGGNGDAVISYEVISGSLANLAISDAGTGYPDGNGQAMNNEPVPAGVPETQANAAEVERAQDAISAMTAIHQLYEAMTNVAVAQSDRVADLRRMS